MASHNLSWVLDVHVRFGDLDFIVMVEGELAMAPTAVRPHHFADLDAIAEALEELRCTHRRPVPPKTTSSSTSTMGGLSAISTPSWDPSRPGRTYAASPFRSPTLWRSLPEGSHSLQNTSSGAPR